MKRRAVSLILLVSFIIGVFSSCSKETEEEKKLNLSVTIDDYIFKADTLNSAIIGTEIAVYTRDFRDQAGSLQLKIGGSHTDRAVFSIKYSNTVEYGAEYTVISQNTSTDDKAGTAIPVNGFVISIPLDKVSGLKIKEDKEINVTGFESIAPVYERFDLCTFIPEDKTHTRRVYTINPIDGVNDQSNITLLTSQYSKDTTLPTGAVAFIMRLVATDNYRISSIQEGGTITKGTSALVFVGEYNALYAKTLFKEDEKLYISREERASSYSDISAVIINNSVYKIGDEKTNLESITESGLYFFNSYHTALVTSARELDFYDVVVVDNTVVYKGEKNTRILIPSNDGVVVSFVGDKAVLAESLAVGDTITTIIIKTRVLPDKYVSIGRYIFELTDSNNTRTSENNCILYTSEFGDTTGTGSDGTEVIISGGKISSIEIARGNATIPDDGYVLSIQNKCSSYKYADNIETGMKYIVALAGSEYSMTTMKYNGVNTTRSTDMLVLYKGIQNTATNAFGYEIIINNEGIIVGDSTSGNSQIPSGGFVLSGHGTAAKTLQELYIIGANVLLNEADKTVKIIKTPALNIENALLAYNNAVEQFNNAKKEFYDIDYASIQSALDQATSYTQQISAAMSQGDYPKAIQLSVSVTDKIDSIQYSMIRSSAVENRAAWYRSSEKSDSEVIATIEKALSLNINAIYLETWYNGMIIGYSDNSLITHNTSANGDYDVLEAFCRIGHEYGIEIHAWVENFFVGTLSLAATNENALINNTYGKHLLDKQGNNYNKTIYGDYVFLNPYDKSNRKLVLDLYREIIEKYDIDGIHLDYIRFPEFNFGTNDYGYNADIIAGFQRKYSTSVDPKTLVAGTEMYDNWCKFREDIINSWVEEVYELVQETKPNLWISSACYPDATIVPKTLYQNFSNWIENGWMDEVFSMSYSVDNSVVKANAALFESMITDKAFYSTGISAFSETTEMNFALQLDLIRDVGADGSAIFSLGSITADNYQDILLQSSYSKKAVQTYLLSKTISAGMNDMLRKLDEVYGYDGNHTFDDKIKPLLNAMIAEADAFDLDNASIEEKLVYVNGAITELQNIITVINSVTISDDDVSFRNALIKDFEQYIEYLTQSQYRLTARLS